MGVGHWREVTESHRQDHGRWVLGGAGVQDDLVLEAMETGEPWKTWREEPMPWEVAMGTGLGRHVEEAGRDLGT